MTSIIQPSRRGFLLGLSASLVAAPAVVRAASLMPVRTPIITLPQMTMEDYYEKILKPTAAAFKYTYDKENRTIICEAVYDTEFYR